MSQKTPKPNIEVIKPQKEKYRYQKKKHLNWKTLEGFSQIPALVRLKPQQSMNQQSL
ncbi:hypothetical protein Syun_031009 [Stephania yunnanensis]|uniref:Uncharacterized protein n=1 Tax=Stephania yunnanensis TaxID=152371 RepID=A0AAP0DZI1_9MAGN